MVAMAYGLYDKRGGKLQLANAGLPHPLLARNGGIETLPVDGTPLGLLPDREYRTESLQVSVGDVVVVCSDGVTEAENERGETFATTRLGPVLEELLSSTAQEIAQGLSLAALEFAGGHEVQRDDYTVMVLKFG